jgi:uncharacterized membrane protein YphA (DoxX/SURF4 family)
LNLFVYRTHPFIAEKFLPAMVHHNPSPGFIHFPDFRISLFPRRVAMRIVAMIARYLLGLVFLVFGLNKFFNFIPGALPPGVAGQFMGALVSTRYIMAVGLFEVAGGVLLLINRYVPLGLALLAPVIVNILLVGILMAPQGLAPGIVVAVLWIVVFLRVRSAYAALFEPTAQD